LVEEDVLDEVFGLDRANEEISRGQISITGACTRDREEPAEDRWGSRRWWKAPKWWKRAASRVFDADRGWEAICTRGLPQADDRVPVHIRVSVVTVNEAEDGRPRVVTQRNFGPILAKERLSAVPAQGVSVKRDRDALGAPSLGGLAPSRYPIEVAI